MENKRERWIDCCRGLGIALMVIGHSGAPDNVVKFIYGFHMPLFFVISGYCFSMEKWEKKGLWSLIKNRFNSYIIPYFLLGIINLFFNLMIKFVQSKSVSEALISALKQMGWLVYSYGRVAKMPNCTPLWFLTCIFVANIYFYLLMLVKSRTKRILLCVGAGGINILCAWLKIGQMPWHVEIALLGIGFMLVGQYLRKMELVYQKMNCWWMIVLIVIGCCAVCLNGKVDVLENQLGNPLLFYFGAIAMSFICMKGSYRFLSQSRVLRFWGEGKHTLVFMGFN